MVKSVLFLRKKPERFIVFSLAFFRFWGVDGVWIVMLARDVVTMLITRNTHIRSA